MKRRSIFTLKSFHDGTFVIIICCCIVLNIRIDLMKRDLSQNVLF